MDNSNSFGFVVDNTTAFWNPSATQISTTSAARTGNRNINSTLLQTNTTSMVASQNNRQSRFNVEEEIVPDNNSQGSDLVKMDVTLIDAFKIKEINLLIGSYVFSMCHNLYILKSNQYVGLNMSTAWFSLGGICGIIISGALVDLVFKKRRFLTILLLNVFITAFDIYLYT